MSNIVNQSPLLCFTSLVKLHLEGRGTRAAIDRDLMTAVLIVVRGLHVPGLQNHWLLGLVPALLIRLTSTWCTINVCFNLY